MIHAIKKIGYGLSIVLGVAVVVFFLFHFSASDPVRSVLGENVSAEVIESTRKKWHLDEPLTVQFFSFLNQISPMSFHPSDASSVWYISPSEISGWQCTQNKINCSTVRLIFCTTLAYARR